MGREKRTGGHGSKSLDLTEVIPVRFTPKATRLIRQRAQKLGVSPSTWVRMRIHDALTDRKD